MGELLRNSASFSIISNGCGCRYQSFSPGRGANGVCCRCFCGCYYGGLAMKTHRRGVARCRLNMVSMPVHQCVWFGHSRMKMYQVNLQFESTRMDKRVYAPKMVASIDSDIVCEDDDENSLIGKGKEEFELDSLGQNLPPWGHSVIDQSLDFESRSAGHPPASTDRKDQDTFHDSQVHFLEERNEEELSRRLLILSRSNKVRSALELCKSMKLSGLLPNAHACNSLLSCLLRNGLLDDALRTFEFMKTNEILTGHTYSLILKAIADTQGCDAALDMFAELERDSEQKKGFDVIVYNTAISICGRLNNWVETERLWRRLREGGYIGTQVTYSLLVSIFVRCNQNELALDAYNEMIQNGLEPQDDTMHAIIGACTEEQKLDLVRKC